MQTPSTATAVHRDTKKSPTYTDKENQENADPSIQSSTRVSPVLEMSHVLIAGGGAKAGDEAPVQNTKEATLGRSVPSPGSTHLSTDAGAGAPAAKKRKLSPASKEAKQQEKEAKQQEKEAKQQEKEAKERQRLEEKAKKEEEKRVKEEEKKKRDAEREEERKRKEEKKKAKEEERAAKEEEKRKKEAAKEEEKRKKEEEKLKKERVSFLQRQLMPHV